MLTNKLSKWVRHNKVSWSSLIRFMADHPKATVFICWACENSFFYGLNLPANILKVDFFARSKL